MASELSIPAPVALSGSVPRIPLPIVPPALTSTVSLLALLLALVALVLATIANRRWARRPHRAAEPDQVDRGAVAEPAPGTAGEQRWDEVALGIDHLRTSLEDLGTRIVALEGRVDEVAVAGSDPTALRHVAVVRYDAFADVGGRLSYSVALLDDTGSGLVLTTLAGKSDVRTYVRTVSGGRGDGTLTAEEQQAIDAAGRRE